MKAEVYSNAMERREAATRLLQNRSDDLLLVAGLGSAVWDIQHASEHRGNFFMLGGMGSVVPTALGLALAQPTKHVAAFTGDSELSMAMYSLATVGLRAPKNLSIICWDNGHFGETGGQISHTGVCLDLGAVAEASGIKQVLRVHDLDGIDQLRTQIMAGQGPLFGHILISPEMPPVVMPIRSGHINATLFREYVLGYEVLKK